MESLTQIIMLHSEENSFIAAQRIAAIEKEIAHIEKFMGSFNDVPVSVGSSLNAVYVDKADYLQFLQVQMDKQIHDLEKMEEAALWTT